jgi:hypothetical protein
MSISRGRLATLLASVWIAGSALLTTVGPYARLDAHRGPAKIPEETPGLSSAGVTGFLSALGPDGRELYARAQWLDFLLPILFGGAALSVLAWAGFRLRLEPLARRALAALPVLVIVAEILENSLLVSAVRSYPDVVPFAGWVGRVTAAKFGLFALTVIAALTTSIWAGIRARRAAP